MRLVRFTEHPAVGPRLGAFVDGDRTIVDLSAARAAQLVDRGATAQRAAQIAAASFADTVTLIESGSEGLATARGLVEAAPADVRVATDDVQLLAPIVPTRLRDFVAFETHMRNWLITRNGLEVPKEYYEIPVYYKGNPRTVVGSGAEVPWPAYSNEWDYELELGVVLTGDSQDVSEDDARSHIFGLTCFNDFSARDALRQEVPVGLGPAKAKDFATGLGPCLVTIDEFDDLYDLQMVARINGEVWSEGNTRDIYWRFEQMIARLSAAEPLTAGEIFGSGTVANGCGLELGRFLNDGDVVELEIQGVGVLRNRVVSPVGVG